MLHQKDTTYYIWPIRGMIGLETDVGIYINSFFNSRTSSTKVKAVALTHF